jgi:hypothetical protein
MSAPTRLAVDTFVLGSDWEAQSATTTTSDNRATSTLANGDIDNEDTYGTVESSSTPYKYIGAETDFDAALTAASARVGEVTAGDLIVSGISIDYSTSGEGQKPVLTMTGRDKPGTWTPDYSCDPIYSPSVSLPTEPCGVPDLLANSDPDSEATSATYSMEAQIGVDVDSAGEEIAMGMYGAEETIALSYYGEPTLTSTGWLQTSKEDASSGTEYSTTGYTFIKGLQRDATTTTT